MQQNSFLSDARERLSKFFMEFDYNYRECFGRCSSLKKMKNALLKLLIRTKNVTGWDDTFVIKNLPSRKGYEPANVDLKNEMQIRT